MMKIALPLLAFMLALGTVGCKEEPVAVETGDILGSVLIYDIDNNLLADGSGVTVSLEGTQFSTTTDTDGRWRLEGVPAGVYTRVFSGDGLAPYAMQNMQFVGTGTYFSGYVSLSALPTFSILDLSLTYNDDSKFYVISGTISENVEPGKIRWAKVVFSTDPNSDFAAEKSAVVTTLTTNAQEGGTQISGVVKLSVLEARGIAAGTPIYFRAYPSGASYISVEDFMTGREEYTDVVLDQGSAVLSDVMR